MVQIIIIIIIFRNGTRNFFFMRRINLLDVSSDVVSPHIMELFRYLAQLGVFFKLGPNVHFSDLKGYRVAISSDESDRTGFLSRHFRLVYAF